jgi:hypothetical protein
MVYTNKEDRVSHIYYIGLCSVCLAKFMGYGNGYFVLVHVMKVCRGAEV